MRVKQDFELVYQTKGKTFNVFPFSESNLKPYILNKEDVDYLKVLSRTQYRIKSTLFGDKVMEDLENIIWVNYSDYPLPGFVTKDYKPVVNVSTLGAILISDFLPADIYAICTYATLLSYYINTKPFPMEIEDQISLFYTSIFISMFGKKSGLLGAYKFLIPRLRFIIHLYVRNGIMGVQIDDKYLNKLASYLGVDYKKDLDLNFNFLSTIDFLRCLNKNKIFNISENSFSTSVINVAGIASLPIFEDCSRLFATLVAGTIYGNHIFSSFWRKKNREVFDKMFYYGVNFLKKRK